MMKRMGNSRFTTMKLRKSDWALDLFGLVGRLLLLERWRWHCRRSLSYLVFGFYSVLLDLFCKMVVSSINTSSWALGKTGEYSKW